MKKIIINIYLMIIFSLILIGCSSTITITYIINNEVKTQEVIKNTTIDNITFYGINEEYIEELKVFKKKTERFLSEVGLSDEFCEFIGPKSVKKELEKKRKELEANKEKLVHLKQEQKGKKIEQEI